MKMMLYGFHPLEELLVAAQARYDPSAIRDRHHVGSSSASPRRFDPFADFEVTKGGGNSLVYSGSLPISPLPGRFGRVE